MSDKTWPPGLFPALFEFELRPKVLITQSGLNGEVQTSEIQGDRWFARMTLPPNHPDDRTQAEIEAFFADVRGPANRIVMGHLKRLSGTGTLSGSVTTGSASRGATAISLSGTGAPAVGDFVVLTTGIGAQFVVCTGWSSPTMTFSPPLRAAVSNGSTINYLTPTTKWLVLGQGVPVGYGADENPGVSVDLMEVW